MLWLYSSNLRDNVRPELLSVFDRYSDTMLDKNPNTDFPQSGKMKTEGYYEEAYVRCLKCYSLWTANTAVKRCKGIIRRATEALDRHHFGGKLPGDSEPMVASWSLNASRGLEMTMSVKTRRLPQRVNFKRETLVVVFVYLQCYTYTFFVSFLFFPSLSFSACEKGRLP